MDNYTTMLRYTYDRGPLQKITFAAQYWSAKVGVSRYDLCALYLEFHGSTISVKIFC